MKIVFISNYMNHHQLPFCTAMYERLGDGFTFIATKSMSDERKALGYKDMSKDYPFVFCLSENGLTREEVEKLCLACDILLVGSAEDDYFYPRLKQGKITIKCSERYFKKGKTLRRLPHNIITAIRHIRKYQKYPLYYLCASAYTAEDVNYFADFSNRTFKWGYFPQIMRYDDITEIQKQKVPATVLWVARFIDWKHPEAMLYLCRRLREDKIACKVEMIGNGPLLHSIQETVRSEKLDDYLTACGALSPEEVRAKFEKASIFVISSDQNEGWGAVLNEAMSGACAVVASDTAGATPYLVSHNMNGFVFQSGNWEQMYQQVKILLKDTALAHRLGSNAYDTMCELWNGDIAAERVIALCTAILHHDDANLLFADGPCSPN